MWNKDRDGYIIDQDYLGNPELITVFYDGSVFDVHNSEPRFQSIYKSINENNQVVIPKFLENENIIKNAILNIEGCEFKNGILSINNEILPELLQQQILEYCHNGLEYKHLVSFWRDLSKNKNNEIKKDLYNFLIKDKHYILKDGCFIAYRTVNKYFKDIHTNTIENKIGQTIKMNKKDVNKNKNVHAGAGLHVATISKAISFGHWNTDNSTKLLAVKVNPRDVVVCINDNDQSYLRVSKYKILSEIEDVDDLSMSYFIKEV